MPHPQLPCWLRSVVSVSLFRRMTRLPSLLSCEQFFMFLYSSSRFEVKLLLAVINHLEVEIYGRDETLCHVGLTLTLGDIKFKLRFLFKFNPAKAKEPERGSIYMLEAPGSPSDKSSIQMKMNVGNWWNENDRRKPQHPEIKFFPVPLYRKQKSWTDPVSNSKLGS